jgi:hypothetical protein
MAFAISENSPIRDNNMTDTDLEPGEDFWFDVEEIRQLRGIERLVAIVVFLLLYAQLSYWLCHNPIADGLSRRVTKARNRIIEWYVIASVVITITNFAFGPWLWLSVLCAYLTVSTMITFLQVLFLSKIFGDVESPERSVILFICNVVQIVFMFAGWYQLVGVDDALFYSMLVLATAGYPQNVRLIVELQITSDLVLLAVFLAHILGKVGKSNPKVYRHN